MTTGRCTAMAVAGCVLIATCGEGGGSALGGSVLHGAIALAVAATLAIGFGDERTELARGPRWAFLAFAGLAIVGSAIAPDFFSAWLVILEIAGFAGVAWLSSRAPGTLMRWLPVTLAIGAAAHGLMALKQRWLDGIVRPPSTFLNVNHLAAWLVAALLVAGAAAASTSEPRRRWIAALLIPAAAALGLSGSRGAALGLLAGSVVLIAASWRTLERRLRVRVLAAVAIVALGIVAGLVSRFHTPDPFPYQRTGIARAAWTVAMEHPWSGSGPGQFATAVANHNFPVDDAPLRYARVFATPHSDWLRAPAEFGWPAAVALAIGLMLVVACVAGRRRAGHLSGEAGGAVAALAALAVQGLVDDLTSRPALVVLAAALFGVLVAVPRGAPAKPWPRSTRLVGAGLTLLVFVIGDLAPYLALRDGDPERNPLSAALWARRAEQVVTSTRSLDLPTYQSAREDAERAVRLAPDDARWLVTLARVEGRGVREIFHDVAGRERVAALYTRAATLARTNALIPLDAALFLRGSGNLDGARREAERCLEIEPRAVAPRLILAAVALDAGEPGARARTLSLVDEAEGLAARYAEVRGSIYERRLLALDPRDTALLRERAGPGGRS